MRAIVAGAIPLAGLLAQPAVSPTATVSPAASVASALQAGNKKIVTYEADVTERVAGLGSVTELTSHLSFHRSKKGDMVRFDYSSPIGDVVVSDGVHTWAYSAATKTAREKMPDDDVLLLRILTGTTPLESEYVVQSFLLSPALDSLTLTPKSATARVAMILVTVHRATQAVEHVVLLDKKGKRHRFYMNSPQLNPLLSASVFQWSPPPGTTIVP